MVESQKMASSWQSSDSAGAVGVGLLLPHQLVLQVTRTQGYT